jgi:hypothetical protein
MGHTQETRKESKHLRINTFDNKEIEWMEITLFVIKGKKKKHEIFYQIFTHVIIWK